MGNYRTTYMELDDFKVCCIQGYPYEGFVIGCGYAYVENIPLEMAILENSSYIYNPIKVQQIDTSLLAIIKSLHLTPDDIRDKLVSEKGDMYVLNIPEGPLTIPKKDSEIIISTDESDTYFNIRVEVKSKNINGKYDYDFNNYNHIDRSSIELVKLLGTKDTNILLDNLIDYSKDIYGYVDIFAESLTKTGKTRISNKNLKLYFEKQSGYVFYGNQYVKTYSLFRIGEKIGNVIKPIEYGLNALEIGYALVKDKGVGDNTQNTILKIGGGMAGGAAGLYLGTKIGMFLGATVAGLFTAGIGIGAGAAIGGFIGSTIGGYLGGELGEDIIIDISNSLIIR